MARFPLPYSSGLAFAKIAKQWPNFSTFTLFLISDIEIRYLLHTANLYREKPVMKTGFSLRPFSLQGKTCFHDRFFPVKKEFAGKTLFSLQGGFAVST